MIHLLDIGPADPRYEVDFSEIPPDSVHFCDRGTSFGNDTDLALCTVTMILLDNNNLDGTLDFPVDFMQDPDLRRRSFSDLQLMSLQNNKIRGIFPEWIGQLPALRSVRLSDNYLDFTNLNQDRAAAVCNQPTVNCNDSGLPGYRSGSCLAFGDDIVMLEPYAARCHQCRPTSQVKTFWYWTLILVLIIVAVYVVAVWNTAKGGVGISILRKYTVMKHGATLKRWVACSAVLSMHFQTLLLVGSVRPFWPKNVQSTRASIDLL
jgi:hypothetical protein